MKLIAQSFLCIILLVAPSMALAGGDHALPAGIIRMELTPEGAVQAGKMLRVTALLTYVKDGKPLEHSDLKRVHTQKFHMMVIDPSLTDYHHVHPRPTGNPGEYSFSFTPRRNSSYRFWADLTLSATGKQEYVTADLTVPITKPAAKPLRVETRHALESGLAFTLSFDSPLRAGKPAMGMVTVRTAGGQQFQALEPIMGAFGHIVAFSEDYHTIMHVHPMGEEPKKSSERGGPTLLFHLEPHHPGFVKLFVQVRVKGKDIFAPFGLMVK